MGRRAWALGCAYDGGAFAGFQRQPPLVTVQGVLEAALARLGLAARVEGAGRTDAGVHARRQVITLRGALEGDAAALPARLARLVPRALSILAAREVDESFHARFSAVAKVYRYRVCLRPDPTPWESRFAWVLPDERGFPGLPARPSLDVAAVREALAAIEGRHDVSCLVHPRAVGKRVRTVGRAELAEVSEGLYELTLAAPGFLRHQVRNVVGVALSAGLGRLAPSELARLVSGAGDRWRGARAPGRGLTLWDVQYRAGEDPFRQAAAPLFTVADDEAGDD